MTVSPPQPCVLTLNNVHKGEIRLNEKIIIAAPSEDSKVSQ